MAKSEPKTVLFKIDTATLKSLVIDHVNAKYGVHAGFDDVEIFTDDEGWCEIVAEVMVTE